MTGHGAAHTQQGDLAVTVELRTVNNRYYKLAARFSDGYGSLEPRVDEVVRKFVRRGTVQLDLRVERRASSDDFSINVDVLANYVRQLREAAERLDSLETIQLERLLDLPGVIEEMSSQRIDADASWQPIRDTLQQALEALSAMRAEEGAAMATDLNENCLGIRQELAAIETRSPAVVNQYRERLTERINNALAEFDVHVEDADLVREVALFAERSDISEEIVRLKSHLDQFQSIMQRTESSGRKLEFITQEMFREANTVGSKANDAEIAAHVVEIKAAVERIREMIQNIE